MPSTNCTRAALARLLNTTPEQISRWVASGVIFGRAVIRGRAGTDLEFNEDAARRQVLRHKEERNGRQIGNPAAAQGQTWKDARTANARIKQRQARIARTGEPIEIIIKPNRSHFGFPIRDVDPATRALIDAAVAKRNNTNAPLHGGKETI